MRADGGQLDLKSNFFKAGLMLNLCYYSRLESAIFFPEVACF